MSQILLTSSPSAVGEFVEKQAWIIRLSSISVQSPNQPHAEPRSQKILNTSSGLVSEGMKYFPSFRFKISRTPLTGCVHLNSRSSIFVLVFELSDSMIV